MGAAVGATARAAHDLVEYWCLCALSVQPRQRRESHSMYASSGGSRAQADLSPLSRAIDGLSGRY